MIRAHSMVTYRRSRVRSGAAQSSNSNYGTQRPFCTDVNIPEVPLAGKTA